MQDSISGSAQLIYPALDLARLADRILTFLTKNPCLIMLESAIEHSLLKSSS